jgi:cobaltochelatase CobN
MSGRNTGEPRLSTVSVEARGEHFNIVQLRGMLMVCSRDHGSCCCGWDKDGRLPFEHSLWGDEWERRKIQNRVHLTFVGCLGPCAVGNVAFLQLHDRSIWFKDLNDARLVPAVFDYIEQMIEAGQALPPPPALADHVFERFVAAGATP